MFRVTHCPATGRARPQTTYQNRERRVKGKDEIRHQVAQRSGHRNTPLTEMHVHEVVDSRRDGIARKRRKEDTGHGSVTQVIVRFKLCSGGSVLRQGEVTELPTRGIKACLEGRVSRESPGRLATMASKRRLGTCTI